MNEKLRIAINALNDKKALNLAAIRIGDLTSVADYFILATATSNTHVKTLAEEVEFKLSEAGVQPHHVEGRSTGWILIDYCEFVVHVFSRDAREFYNLDKMWYDGESIDLNQYLENSTEE